MCFIVVFAFRFAESNYFINGQYLQYFYQFLFSGVVFIIKDLKYFHCLIIYHIIFVKVYRQELFNFVEICSKALSFHGRIKRLLFLNFFKKGLFILETIV